MTAHTMEAAERQTSSKKPDHLCVLVHGLWGNPTHLANMAKTLQERHPADTLHVLIAAKNASYFTYDGIDVGGERVAQEIEDHIATLASKGHTIRKLSLVGYSLGGLITRYCIGLLYARGWFDGTNGKPKITPVNFHCFASPHLGVRTPGRGYGSSIWNKLGGVTLSFSGRQLFLIDDFRETGRPLLSVMADGNSIFMKALRAFKNRVLYCNIVNDRSAPFSTTGISATDPFIDLDALEKPLPYLEGYDDVILDPSKAVRLKKEKDDMYTVLVNRGNNFISRLPLMAFFTLILPIGATFFLVSAGYQTYASSGRLRDHETGKLGDYRGFRVPLMLEGVARETEGTGQPKYLNKKEAQEALMEAHESATSHGSDDIESANGSADLEATDSGLDVIEKEQQLSDVDFPTLALTAEQFAMVDSLNRVGWTKFRVHIKLVTHSHAAIVVRSDRGKLKEGYTVFKHWLDEAFEI